MRALPRNLAASFSCSLALALLVTRTATALDKQGSGAHGGAVEAPESGFDVSGAVSMGISPFNPTYAARPDNTGLTLMRYAGHADIDIIGRRLSIPVDVNMFSDSERRKLNVFVPSELDVILGITSTWRAGPGALEVGTRIENDRPLDRDGTTQTYVDARARYLYSIASVIPCVGKALANGDISGWATLGWFAFNPTETSTYFARPDNTGRALFRYALHTELSLWNDRISFGFDATMFTDSRSSNVVGPSELDFTPEIIGRISPFELHVAYERDMPVDRGGLVQHFMYLLFVYGFDLKHAAPPPLETRGTIVSP